MKVVELLAERKKTINMLRKLSFYKVAPISPSPCFLPQEEGNKFTEQDFKRNYEKAMKLLKRMDALNNALHESDSAHHVEVMGIRLSVATARQYLEEFRNGDGDEFTGFVDDEFSCVGFDNLRWDIWNKCNVWRKDNPTGGSEDEFEEKKQDWFLGLKTALAISDANTEVTFCD